MKQYPRAFIVSILFLAGCSSILSQEGETVSGAARQQAKPGYTVESGRDEPVKLHRLRIFGSSKSTPQSGPVLNDPDYAAYREWKRWQEFKAYQEWKAQKESQAQGS